MAGSGRGRLPPLRDLGRDTPLAVRAGCACGVPDVAGGVVTRRDWRTLGQAVAMVAVTCLALAAVVLTFHVLVGQGVLVWAWVVFVLGVAGVMVGLVAATAALARRNEDRCWMS